MVEAVAVLLLAAVVTINADEHYCKHCERTFLVRISKFENRAMLLECPRCHWQHPRQFEAGIAVHCDINRMLTPARVKGE